MKPSPADLVALQTACCGNAEAMRFLALWSEYVHAIDDVEDEDTTAEFRLRTHVLALELYTNPFFVANMARLKQVVLNITNLYADSLAWEHSVVDWQRQWADVARSSGAEMIIAVAQLCGGYDHARRLSLDLRRTCYEGHHNEKGQPI